MEYTDRKKIFRAGTVYTLANILLKGVSFFTLPIFIRLLTPDEFGRFSVFISFQAIIFMFSGLTLHASVKNAKYDFLDDYDSYLKNCIYIDFFNSIVIAFFANFICFFWSEKIDLSFYEVNILTLSGFCGAAISVYSSKLIMEYSAGDYAVVSFLSVIIGIVLSLLLIFTIFDFDHYLGRIVGLVMGEVVAAGYAIWRLFRSGFSPVRLSYWRYGLNISLPIIPHGLSQIALSSANRIMIKYMYDAVRAGVFSFTYTVSMVPQILFQSVSNVWEPWFFERMKEGDEEQIRKKSNLFCMLISVVFVLMSCITPEIVKFFATAEYYDAIDISIVVLMGCYFATLYNIPCEVEYYFKKTKHIALSTFVCALVNICLNLVLMRLFSYKIAAYVTLLSYLLYFMFHMYMSYRIMKKMIFDLKTMMYIIIGSVICMLLVVLSVEKWPLRLCVCVILLSLVFRNRRFWIQFVKSIRK